MPKVVVLPNIRQCKARYKRATTASLPGNVTLSRTYKQRAAPRNRRRRQRRRGIGRLIKKLIKFPIVRELTKKALKQASKVYSKFADKVKNKKLKRILQSDIANSLVEKGTTYARKT